jgi:hypothetical protein
MKQPTDMGMNRTGIEASPIDAKATLEGARQGGDTSALGDDGIAAIRKAYTKEAGPVGSMPLPATVKGAVKTAVKSLTKRPAVFLDKLGERIAFERSGTRLYDALITKLDACGTWAGGPTKERLSTFRDQELFHFHLLSDAMKKVGGDPTAVTPCADVVGVEASGLLAVIADPRTTLDQALGALLVAELSDHASWSMLVDLAEAMKEQALAESFRSALAEEQVHLDEVRSWVERFTRDSASKDVSTKAA